MREIKFRAWNNLTEKMVTNETVTIYPDGSIEVGGYNTDTDDEPIPAIVVMQYTGLKDKNGKDIYEGDILKSAKETHIVTWDSDKAEWRGVYPTLWKYGYAMQKVIGNIYENKELLK